MTQTTLTDTTDLARLDALPFEVPPRCPPGAEPSLVVQDGPLGDVGVLIIHGFTGTPWEVRPLVDVLTRTGFTVGSMRLPGHATTPADLDRTRKEDWVRAAERAFEVMAARVRSVHVVGFSMGGLLALLLAARTHAPRPRSLTLLAPALATRSLDAWAVRLLAALGRPRFVSKGPFDISGGGPVPPSYTRYSIAAAASFFALVRDVANGVRPTGIPALVVHGDADLTIPLSPARRASQRIVGPHALYVTIAGGKHHLLYGSSAAKVTDIVTSFVRSQVDKPEQRAITPRF